MCVVRARDMGVVMVDAVASSGCMPWSNRPVSSFTAAPPWWTRRRTALSVVATASAVDRTPSAARAAASRRSRAPGREVPGPRRLGRGGTAGEEGEERTLVVVEVGRQATATDAVVDVAQPAQIVDEASHQPFRRERHGKHEGAAGGGQHGGRHVVLALHRARAGDPPV